MVHHCHLRNGDGDYSGTDSVRPERGGEITSITSRQPLELAKIGRIKCIADKVGGEVELIHYSNHERTRTLCGKRIVEKRPYMGNVIWGSAGNDWCEQCEEQILAQMK